MVRFVVDDRSDCDTYQPNAFSQLKSRLKNRPQEVIFMDPVTIEAKMLNCGFYILQPKYVVVYRPQINILASIVTGSMDIPLGARF